MAAACIAIAREVGEQMFLREPVNTGEAAEFVVRLILGGVSALPRVEP